MSSIAVLLVEDNPLSQKITQELLTSKGCCVDTAGNGAEALTKFQNNHYQMVLMDIGLPDSTGYEITQQIRAYEIERRQSPIWIVGLTATAEKEELYRGIHAGMNDIFSKPLTVQLVDDILQLVSSSRLAKPMSRDSVYNINNHQVIDLNLGAQILGTTVDNVKKMVAELVKMLPADLKKIEDAFANKNYLQLKYLAHYMKGGASFCGTPRLIEAADQLDKAITFNNDDQDLQAAYERLRQEISAVINEYQVQIKKM